jgi:hypothetical protein
VLVAAVLFGSTRLYDRSIDKGQGAQPAPAQTPSTV